MDELETQLSNLGRSFAGFNKAIQESLLPAMQTLGEAANRLEGLAYAEYEKSGMPYGASREGFYIWLNDMAVIAQHQRAIDEIKREHQIRAIAQSHAED